MNLTTECSLHHSMDLLLQNVDARKHFLLETKPVLNILTSETTSKNDDQKRLCNKRRLSAHLITVQQAENIRTKEDYAQLLSITSAHQSCLERIPDSCLPQFMSLVDSAKAYEANLSLFAAAVALSTKAQQETGYVIALYNSYVDTASLNMTFGALAMLVATVQVEVLLTMFTLTKYAIRTPAATSSASFSQTESSFLRFVAAVRSYIGADESYFLTRKQKRALAACRTKNENTEASSCSSNDMLGAFLGLLERYGSIHQPATAITGITATANTLEGGRVTSNISIKQRQVEAQSLRLCRTGEASAKQPTIKPEEHKTTTFRQKPKTLRYPSPPVIESRVTRTQIDPPLKLLDMGGISIFPSGYGPIDLLYKGYRVGIQEMFGLTKAAFGAAMARTSYNMSENEVESLGSDTSSTPLVTAASTMDATSPHAAFLNKRPSLDVSLLAKAQVSWVQNRWINLASCDPSDLQLLCLEQTMASTIEDSLVNKQVDTEQIRQSISSWGDKCIKIALKAPLPKTWTPILTQDGLYVRFLDNKTGIIFNINPEVKEIQKRIDYQYKLLEKYVRLHKNSEIMKDYELIKRFISTRFVSLDLCKNTSSLFKELVEEFSGLVTQIGNVITLWAPLYNTSDINLAEGHNSDDKQDSNLRFNL